MSVCKITRVREIKLKTENRGYSENKNKNDRCNVSFFFGSVVMSL